MESDQSPGATELHDFDRDHLRHLVEIYLRIAYPEGAWPDAVKRRLLWMTQAESLVDLTSPPFEPAPSGNNEQKGIISLRLGNHRYPHMKLQVQPWTSSMGYLVSVNTHDQVLAPSPGSPDSIAFRELQAENLRIKLAIESAWEANGVPTFLGYLRDYLRDESSGTSHAPNPDPSSHP